MTCAAALKHASLDYAPLGKLTRFSLHAAHAALLAVATLALAAVPALSQTAQATQRTPSAPSTVQPTASSSKNAEAAAPQSPYHGDVVEDIIARINDQVISSSDFLRASQELEAQGKQRNLSPTAIDEQKKQLLCDLIDNQLLLSRGKQLGITGESETIRQLDELRKQNNLDSLEALEKAAEQQGVSFADFKANIQNRVITSQVIRDEVGRRISITTGEEQQYYNDHKDQFTTPESVKLSEILIPTADPDNAAQVAEAQTKADALEGELKGGKPFADVAKASSGNSTAAQGGVLGDYKRGQLASVLEDAVFPLALGQYTAPIRTKQGFVILKVDGHTAAGLQPFEEAKPQVEDALGGQKINPALRAYLTRLREEAFISIKPGFVDTAATSDEFRPIFSAYTPPQPKKKKAAVARTRFSGSARTRNTPSLAAKASKPEPAAAAPPAGVPSLADVPGGSTNTAAAAPATTLAAPATPAISAPKTIAKVQKPGRREKVRFGQAPLQSLPSAETQTQDAGATAAGGNGSNVETAANVPQTAPGGTGAVPGNIHFSNGESATDEQVEVKKVKTRYSQQAAKVKAAKIEKKANAKADVFPSAPADSQETADKQTQAQPLGLAGDTSKKVPKPKPTEKTRYSEAAGKDKDAQPAEPAADPNVPPSPAAPTASQFGQPAPQAPAPANDHDVPAPPQSAPAPSADPLVGSPAPAAQPPR